MGASTKPAPSTAAKDRVGLRLFNVIIIYDDYVIAKSPGAAREALESSIASGDLDPMEQVSKEVTMANSIRTSKVGTSPLVAADVTDEEFETLKGITNSAAFERFYTRRA